LKPRILFLVPAELEALRKKGVDRMILERDEFGFFERVVTIHPLTATARIVDLNATHRVYELGGRLSPLSLARVCRDAVRIAREERVNLVRATDAYLMGLIAWRVARALGIPFCVSVHADYAKRFALSPAAGARRVMRGIATRLSPFVLRRADLVLPIRESLVPALVAAGAAASRIRVIPHGVDLSMFNASDAMDCDDFDVPAGKLIVSVVGRLTADNYAADLEAAIARVAGRRKDVMFVIVGEGPEAPRFQRLLDEYPDAVRVWPFQSRERVARLRRRSAASLCLMAGFSLIEACAAGSPPIAYDVEWHRELVQNGVTGYLVAEHDVDGVVGAIERLLDTPAERTAMGARARALAFERHDLAATSRIKQQCYTALLAGAAR
jgi:glycosyltransferase involved in cell wall biosynthesis